MNPSAFRTALYIALMLPALPHAGHAQTVDYSRSQITVTSRQMNVPVEAKFSKFSAQLAFDPARPESGKARIEVDLASFDIGNDDVNNEARGKNWFDIAHFPKATFVSSGVRALGGNRYEVRGPLTIKGRTHDITVSFAIKPDAAGNPGFEGAFPIRRLQYSIGDGVWRDTDTVADEVQIKFRLQTTGKPSLKK